MRAFHFEVWQSEEDGQFYCTIVAANGQTLFTSEGYRQERSARAAVDLVKASAAAAPVETW